MGRFAIGSDDFIKFKEKSEYYIDKSLLIKEVTEDTNEVLLITRPRRFGKTLNMSMLNSYLTYNDEDYSEIYSDLKIWEEKDIRDKYFQKTPTIFFTMKNINCDNWELCYKMLVSLIAGEYRKYKYLQEFIDEQDKITFSNILNKRHEYEEDFRNSLLYLSKWLYKYHKKKVYIIIDEYDTPIHEGYNNDYYDKIINFIQVFFGAAMKTNPYLDKAILTGITKIAGESLFSKLNLFVSYNIRKKQLGEFFGFTEEETKIAVEKYAPHRKMEDVKRMYDGYLIGGVGVYNPWSIMNMLDNEEDELQPYWHNTSSVELLRQEFARKPSGVKEDLLKLASGEVIAKKIKDEVTYKDLADTGDTVWSFLLYLGYLTLDSMDINTEDDTYNIRIPNEEVRKIIENYIENWFSKGMGTADAKMLFDAMLTGDIESFEEQLQYKVENSFSYFDTTKTRPEIMYHAFILGMLVLLQKDYYCESNAIVGRGRCDILICPKVGMFKDVGVILEFKKTRYENQLEKVTEDALLQIRDRNYIEGAKKRGVKTIYCYGIGFYRAELMMKMEKVEEVTTVVNLLR